MDLDVDLIENVAFGLQRESHLDLGNNRLFVESMKPIIEVHLKIVVDMSNIMFLDSSGLGSIMLCSRRIKSAGGQLKLCGLTESVGALFELVRMNRVFDIYESREAVLNSFESDAP